MAVKTVEVLHRQTISDIAIQEYGGVEGLLQLIKDNEGLTLTSNLTTGQLLKITAIPVNKVIAAYFKDNNLHPATKAGDATSGNGDFNNDFNNDFNS